jgi:hypothetical protein
MSGQLERADAERDITKSMNGKSVGVGNYLNMPLLTALANRLYLCGHPGQHFRHMSDLYAVSFPL